MVCSDASWITVSSSMVAPAPLSATAYGSAPRASGEPSSGTRIVNGVVSVTDFAPLHKRRPAAAIFADAASFREETQKGGGSFGCHRPATLANRDAYAARAGTHFSSGNVTEETDCTWKSMPRMARTIQTM